MKGTKPSETIGGCHASLTFFFFSRMRRRTAHHYIKKKKCFTHYQDIIGNSCIVDVVLP